jgi:hypothetical protein
MKAKDLMFDDYLWSDRENKAVVVNDIIVCNEEKYDIVATKPLDKPDAEETIYLLYDNPGKDVLHGMPITAEWLKDNGWNVYSYYASCPQVSIKTDGKIWMVTYYPNIHFNYVHELQHFMRLFKNPSKED